MKNIITQTILLILVATGAFFALYLQKIPSPHSVKNVVPAEVSPLFTVKIDPAGPVAVGIFGESYQDEIHGGSFNAKAVEETLDSLKKNRVQAIFFTGDLVDTSAKDFEEKLNKFSMLYSKLYGTTVPFFPVLGNHELAIPNAAQIEKSAFHLNNALIMDKGLAYGVSVGPAFFAVIPSMDITPTTKPGNTTSPSEVLTWLNKTLEMASKNHEYLFVVGHEPAFPSSETLSKNDTSRRDAFWRILSDNHVFAYFSAKEHLFDRSDRSGVWQIISGGGGAPLNGGGGNQPFFHSIVLKIPAGKNQTPSIQVIDLDGNLVGDYSLKDQQTPIFQMRIP